MDRSLAVHPEDVMYYGMGYYPTLGAELARSIAAIREIHDPTAFFIPPHVTLLFPTALTIGEDRLLQHVEGVLRGTEPFEVQFGGFSKSRDHWLFLDLMDGAEQVRSLYRNLYSGILAEGRNETFVPHVGLWLFLKPGTRYDYRNPRESDFDGERFDAALRQAHSLPVTAERFRVDALRMNTIPDSVAEWTVGQRESLPRDARLTPVREFRLGRLATKSPAARHG